MTQQFFLLLQEYLVLFGTILLQVSVENWIKDFKPYTLINCYAILLIIVVYYLWVKVYLYWEQCFSGRSLSSVDRERIVSDLFQIIFEPDNQWHLMFWIILLQTTNTKLQLEHPKIKTLQQEKILNVIKVKK